MPSAESIRDDQGWLNTIAVVGHGDDDEEAQLLPTHQFDFEEGPPSPTRPGRFCSWIHGPHPPRRQTIRPLFPTIQTAPLHFLHRLFPEKQQKILLLCSWLLLWLFIFTTMLLQSQLPVQDSQGNPVINLDCTDTLWRRKNECGLDGIDCRPFSNSSFSFRCPANCASVKLLNPHAVGALDVNYRPLVIGDGNYRGDSFICASAIHSSVVTDSYGGCGRLMRIPDHMHFPSSTRHGIASIPFASYFPLSFSITSDTAVTCPTGDPRKFLLFVSILFSAVLCFFCTTPLVFAPLFIQIFTHVSFVSDPPSASYHNTTVLPDHISAWARRLLPACFCAAVLYRSVIRRTLSGLSSAAPVEKTILWLGGLWFGALSNYTFDWIPISRLTGHGLEQQPGAKLALAIILLVLVLIIAGQIYCFWVEGRLARYLRLYALFLAAILLCLAIPGVQLRIHHYILALLFLPGTALQTRASLLYQGILLGLFINGIARWDFDSVLQTAADLRADGAFGSLLPSLLPPTLSWREEGDTRLLAAVFTWKPPPSESGMHGLSVLVNDVERARVFFADAERGAKNFSWVRDAALDVPEYLRFAFVREGRTLDYTPAWTLFGNGSLGTSISAGLL